MTVATKTQLLSSVATRFPDNTLKEITPARLRTMLQDIMDSMAVTAGIADGQLLYKSGDGIASASGVRVLSNGTVLAPLGFGVESGSVDFGDVTRLTESNSFLRIFNQQFPATRFDLIDARTRRTGASSRPRQFYQQSADVNLTVQNVDTTDITTGPITFNLTATGTRQINELVFRAGAEMTNVRARIRYNASPNTVVKYWPSKAVWEDGTGGRTLTPDGSNDINIVFDESPFRVILGDVYQVEVRADSYAFKGNSSDVPYIMLKQQPSEFRDIAWLQDVVALINDTSIGTDKTRSAENIAQKNSEALKFNARNGQTYALAVGDIVAAVGGDTWQNGNVEHIELIREKGSAASFLLPIGVMAKAMASNTNAEQSVVHKGHFNVTIPGQNDLPLDTPIYVTRTGSGDSEQWGFTHDGSGSDTYFVGRIHNDAGENTYWAWIDFGLVWAHAGIQNGMGVDVLINGTEVLANVTDINFVGDHVSGETNGSQINVNIDPGSMMLTNGSGATMQSGDPAYIGSAGGQERALAVDPAGSVNNIPTLWAAGTIANGAAGNFVSEGEIKSALNVETGASVQALAPIAANTPIQWRPDGGVFTTVTQDANFIRVGEVRASRYVLDETTFFDSDLAFGNVGISTAAAANAARNATIVVKASYASGAALQVPNLNLDQPYTTPFLVGDRIAFTNSTASDSITVNQQTGGTMQNLGGTGITSFSVNPNSSAILERIAGNIWKIVAISEGIVENDIIVSFDRLGNGRDSRQNNRIFSLENRATAIEAIDDLLIRSAMRGLDTYTTNSSTVVIQAGECGSDDGGSHISVTSDITLTLSNTTLDTGTEAASTWYYIWLFKETTGSGVIARYSTSNSAPTVPSGYTAKRLIGAVRNDGSSNFRQFRCQGAGSSKVYTYNTEFLSLNNVSVISRTTVTVTNEVPSLPVTGYPYCQVGFEYGNGSLVAYNGDNTGGFIFMAVSAGFAILPNVQLNTSGQFHIANHSANVTGVYMKVLGFKMELH